MVTGTIADARDLGGHCPWILDIAVDYRGRPLAGSARSLQRRDRRSGGRKPENP
jgi:hypothetical protein